MKKILLSTVAALFCATSLCLADDCNTPTISAATITFTYQELPPAGVASSKAKFSINSNGDQVFFSRSNLAYFSSKTAPQWKLYDSPTQSLSEANVLCDYSNIVYRNNLNKWLDLFWWGTGENPTNTGHITSAYKEWGNNDIISLDVDDEWRTLSKDEWDYVLSRKKDDTHYLYGCGTLNNVKGIFLFPDNWEMPASCNLSFTYYVNNASGSWTNNKPTDAQWEKMEEAGAVFLPVTGTLQLNMGIGWNNNSSFTSEYGCMIQTYQYSTDKSTGYYWTSTYNVKKDNKFYYAFFNGGSFSTKGDANAYPCAVRLVLPVKK